MKRDALFLGLPRFSITDVATESKSFIAVRSLPIILFILIIFLSNIEIHAQQYDRDFYSNKLSDDLRYNPFLGISKLQKQNKVKLKLDDSIKVAVFLIIAKDKKTPNYTAKDVYEKYFSKNSGVRKLIQEASYGKADLFGDVFGWYKKSSGGYSLDEIQKVYNIDFSKYDHICTIDPDDWHAPSGSTGREEFTINGNSYTLGEFALPADSIFFIKLTDWTIINDSVKIQERDQFPHELGHAMGLGHASCYFESQNSDTSYYRPYANRFDYMGAGNYTGYGMHYNGQYKEFLGWMDTTLVLEINKSGIYKIFPFEINKGKVLAKIKFSNAPKASFYLEHRIPAGFDINYKNSPSSINGLLIYPTDYEAGIVKSFEEGDIGDNFLMDVSPTNNYENVTLNPGATFYNRDSSIVIKTLSSNKDSTITFQVTLKEYKLKPPELKYPLMYNTASRNGPFLWSKVDSNESYHFQIKSSKAAADYYISIFSVQENKSLQGTIYYSPLLDFGQYKYYYWRVRAISPKGESPWSNIYLFSVNESINDTTNKLLPEPLKIDLPHDDALLSPIYIHFIYGSSTNATNYQLQIDTVSNFITCINDFSNSIERYITLPKIDKRYYWHIRGTNSFGNGPWSETRTFTTIADTANALPEVPKLIEPSQGQQFSDSYIRFLWNKSFLANGYILQVSRDTNFATLVYECSSWDVDIAGIYFDKNNKYYWRVSSKNSRGYSDWSETRYFVIGKLSGVKSGNDDPNDFSLAQNYPNPFNPLTQIKYSLPGESFVKIYVYNTLGEVIKVLTNAVQSAGYYEVSFNAGNVSSGIYFYKIEANATDGSKRFNEVKKMLLLK